MITTPEEEIEYVTQYLRQPVEKFHLRCLGCGSETYLTDRRSTVEASLKFDGWVTRNGRSWCPRCEEAP